MIAKKKRREISVEGEVDPITLSRILAFYRAIAARIASSRNENPLKVGVYTFFTGMAGLAELYNQEDNDS